MKFSPYPKPTPRIKASKPLRKSPRPQKADILLPYNQVVQFADRYFSEYVRLVGSDEKGFVKCFTCDEKLHYKQMDCGHFENREFKGTRYELKNCKPQCAVCNRANGGMTRIFAENLKVIYSEEILNELYKMREGKLSKSQILQIGNLFKEKVKEIKFMKSLK